MKKLIVLFICIMLLLVFSGCVEESVEEGKSINVKEPVKFDCYNQDMGVVIKIYLDGGNWFGLTPTKNVILDSGTHLYLRKEINITLGSKIKINTTKVFTNWEYNEVCDLEVLERE